MALPTGITGATRANNPSHAGVHNELHFGHNQFHDGDYMLRRMVANSRDGIAPTYPVWPLGVGNTRARRFTSIDGDASDPVTEDVVTAFISRHMRPDGATIYGGSTAFVAVATAEGSVGSGFLSANGINGYGVTLAGSDADNLGVGGVGVVQYGALHAVRVPNAFGLFGDGTALDPYAGAFGVNPLVATVTSYSYNPGGGARIVAGVFTQSYPTSNHAGVALAVTISNPGGVVTHSAHGMLDGETGVLTVSGGSLPTGLSANTIYYVRDKTANTFKLAATLGGSAITVSSAGSGTFTFTPYVLTGPGYANFANFPANSQSDVSFASYIGAAKNASYRSDDQAVAFLKDAGQHTYGWDLSEGTYGYYYFVNADTHFAPAGGTFRHTYKSNVDYVDYVTAGRTYRFTGAGNLLGQVYMGWTPAVAETAFYMAEGTSPTLRQVQWKAGNTLGSGDKVLVLV